MLRRHAVLGTWLDPLCFLPKAVVEHAGKAPGGLCCRYHGWRRHRCPASQPNIQTGTAVPFSAGFPGCPVLPCSCSKSSHLQKAVLSLSASFAPTHMKESSCTSEEQAVDPSMRVRNSVAPHGQSNVVMPQLRRQFHERWRGWAAAADNVVLRRQLSALLCACSRCTR